MLLPDCFLGSVGFRWAPDNIAGSILMHPRRNHSTHVSLEQCLVKCSVEAPRIRIAACETTPRPTAAWPGRWRAEQRLRGACTAHRRWRRRWRGRAEKGGQQGAAASPQWLCSRSSAAARELSPCRCGKTEAPLGGPLCPGEIPT